MDHDPEVIDILPSLLQVWIAYYTSFDVHIHKPETDRFTSAALDPAPSYHIMAVPHINSDIIVLEMSSLISLSKSSSQH